MVPRGLRDYRVLMANPRFFREGQVSASVQVAEPIQNVIPEMEGRIPGVLDSPLAHSEDFPLDGLIVNVGLTLWED